MDPRIAAKRSLGQNFLINEGVLDRIITEARLSSDDTVVEVGPGTGALTLRLAATGARIVAIEKDGRLIGPLRAIFAARPNVSIIEGDILKWMPESSSGPYKVVGNIPYYLTSHFIRRMLWEWPAPSLAVLMVQSEVASRILAAPPDMNLLALSVGLRAKPSLVMRVSRGSFRPMPEVDSAVIRLDIMPRRGDEGAVMAVAKPAFAHKRKQLKASVDGSALTGAGIAPTARPQELSKDDWRRIVAQLR